MFGAGGFFVGGDVTTLQAPTAPAPETPAPSTTPAPETTDAAELELPVLTAEGDEAPVKAASETPAPSAPTKPTATAPESPQPTPTAPLLAAPPNALANMQRQYAEQQAAMEQLQDQMAEASGKQLAAQYRQQLEAQYPGVDVTPLAQKYEALLTQERTAAKQQRDAQQQVVRMQQNQQAKGFWAEMLSKQYGMPINELLAFNDPLLMESKAETWQAKQENSRLKQAQLGPQTPTNSAPSRARVSVTADNIDKLHMEGKVSDTQYRNFLRTQEI